MDALITGETDELVGLSIIDNDDAEHVLDVRKEDGKITGHESDGYADKAKERTNEGNEHVNQAARYAKFHVYRERGYDTLTPYENPDRLAAVALVISTMGSDSFRQHFGDLYDQVRSHHGDSQPSVELPESIDLKDVLFYRQHVYLGLDEDDLRTLAELFADDALEPLFERVKTLSATEDDTDVRAELQSLAETADTELSTDKLADDLLIDAVSDVHVRWDEGLRERLAAGDDPREREPDARLEVFPLAYEPDSIEEFQRQLVHHLKCQIRDCYVGMGLTPPEVVQLTGPGQYTYSNWYQNYDVYQSYHDPGATINWEAV